MSGLDLSTVDQLLTTTRSVRKRLDLTRPVDPAIIRACLEIAIQAPTGSNRQNWHFVVVVDPAKRAAIGDYYAQSFERYLGRRTSTAEGAATSDDPATQQMMRVTASSLYLAQHMGDVPVLIIPCIEGRPQSSKTIVQASHYGSILPAAWSLMLALRARGLGSAWTTLHLRYENEVAALLGIPDTITQAALLPVAYYTGEDFKPAQRRPARELTYWDDWGTTT